MNAEKRKTEQGSRFKKNYESRVRRKRNCKKNALSYWKYTAGFAALQFAGKFLEYHTIPVTFLFVLEWTILALIGVTLLAFYELAVLDCWWNNREKRYRNILVNRFIPQRLLEKQANGLVFESVVTLISHPEIGSEAYEHDRVWGWGNDGTLLFSVKAPFKAGRKLSLKGEPWTSTAEKIVRLRLEETQETETIPCGYGTLGVCALFVDEEGRVLKYQKGGTPWFSVRFPFYNKPPKASEIAEQGGFFQETTEDGESFWTNQLSREFFEECKKQLPADIQKQLLLTDEYGVLAVAQDTAAEEAFLAVAIRVEAKETMPNVKWINRKRLIALLMQKISEKEPLDAQSWYTVLQYIYAGNDRFDFVEEFIQEARKHHISSGRPAQERISKQSSLNLPSARNLWFRFCYGADHFITENKWQKGLVLLAAMLEDVIEPLASAGTQNGLGAAEIFATLRSENLEGSAEELLFLAAFWGLALLLRRCKRLHKPAEKMETLCKAYRTESGREIEIAGNINFFYAEDAVAGWDKDSVRVRVLRSPCRHSDVLKPYLKNWVSEKNNGTKYMLTQVNQENGRITLFANPCTFVDTMCAKQYTEDLEKNGEIEKFIAYRAEILNLKAHTATVRPEMILPNSLCMHAIIVTKDNYVLVTKRSEKLKYHPGRLSCSIEEQLCSDDVGNDGIRICNWAERACREELGLTVHNSGAEGIGDIRVMAVFVEAMLVNVAVCTRIKCAIDKEELRSILESWPRQDYEFTYEFLTWDALVEKYCAEPELFHPTAVNRIFWGACAEQQYDALDKLRAYLLSDPKTRKEKLVCQ